MTNRGPTASWRGYGSGVFRPAGIEPEGSDTVYPFHHLVDIFSPTTVNHESATGVLQLGWAFEAAVGGEVGHAYGCGP